MNANVTALSKVRKDFRGPLSTESGEMLIDIPDDSISLAGIVAMIRRRIHIVIGLTSLIVAVTTVYTFSVTPRYTATVQLLLEQREKNVLEQESVAAGLPAENNAVDTEVEVLKSPALASRVINTFALADDAEFNPPEDRAGLLRVLVAQLKAASGAFGQKSESGKETPASAAASASKQRNDVLKAFQSRTAVRRVGLTYVVEVSFSSEDPAKATAIANAIADEYINDQIGAKINANTRANDWLAQRLIKLRDDLLASERRAAQFRAEKGLTNAKGTLLNEQQISELNAQLIQARAELAEERARLERIRILVRGGGDLGTVAEVVQSPTISRLREQQAQVVRRRGELSSKYGARHPEIIKVDRELADLGAEIRNEVNRIIASLENDMDISGERVQSLERSLSGMEVENSEDNQVLVELRQLEREAEASRTLYQAFLERFNQTSEASLFEDADARIVARAEAPSKASWPNKKLNLAFALAFSGVLGLGVAYLIDSLDNGLRTNAEVERATGLPVLASVPAVRNPRPSKKNKREKSPANATLGLSNMLSEKPFSRFSESWRSLGAALSLVDIDNPPKVFLMTSAIPGEGKTSSSLCFARELSRSNSSVLVVDCDFRRASLTRALMNVKKIRAEVQQRSAERSTGIVELLSGECSLNEAVIAATPTLSVLPLIRRPSVSSRLLMSDAFRKLMSELRERFDYVIIDSAPMLPFADSRLLALAADAVIFAIRWDHTPKQAVQAALRDLASSQARIAGVLMTFIDMRKQQRYGYSDGSYYYGDYGYEKDD